MISHPSVVANVEAHFGATSVKKPKIFLDSTACPLASCTSNTETAAAHLMPKYGRTAEYLSPLGGSDLVPGERIRQRRAELGLRPSQIERISTYFSLKLQDRRCAISHSILAGIESGAIPSFYKLLSLAYCLRLTEEQILDWYGIDMAAVRPLLRQRATSQAGISGQSKSALPDQHFPFRWPSEPPPPRTLLLEIKVKGIPAGQPVRFRYARIGSHDDSMTDMLPPGCIVQIDTHQRHIVTFPWRTIWHRPIYLIWHAYGHTCCWCQQDGAELFLIGHPASHYPIRRFRSPRDANIVGRVIRAWAAHEQAPIEFPSHELSHAVPH